MDVRDFLRLLFLDGTVALETDDSRRSITSAPGVELVDKGLPGFDRPVPLGGCGKAPMLTVLRSDLPGGRDPTGMPSAVRVGTEGELPCRGPGRWGSADDETARFARDGKFELEEDRVATPIFECRVFATGSEGRGPVGGAMEGREGRGRLLLDMLARFYPGAAIRPEVQLLW